MAIEFDQNNDAVKLDNYFDPNKAMVAIRKSLPWVVIIFCVATGIAYMYIRYTPSVFESSSLIKLDEKSEASILGIGSSLPSDPSSGMSGQLEILKSDVFLGKVADVLNYEISYYLKGSILEEERYDHSPFLVEVLSDKSTLASQSIRIRLIDEFKYELSKLNSDQEKVVGFYNQPIHYNGIKLQVFQNGAYSDDYKHLFFYFRINSKSKVIKLLKNNLKVNVENPSARTIRISMVDRNKHKARDFIAAVDTIYLKYSIAAKNQALEQKLLFLESQLKITEKKIDNYETYFENFVVQHRTLDLNSELGESLQRLNQLDTQRYFLKNNIIKLGVFLDHVRKEKDITFNPFTNEYLPDILKSSVTDYLSQYEKTKSISRSYSNKSTASSLIQEELKESRESLIWLIEEYLKVQKETLGELNKNRKIFEAELFRLPAMKNSYNKKRRFYNLEVEFYFSLIKTRAEMEITKAGTVTNYTVLSPPSLPFSPLKPNKDLIYIVALLVSLVLSLLFITAKYLINNQILSQKEMELLTSVPILGSIPFYRKEKLPLTKLVVNGNPKSAISEAMRSIRTSMQFISGAKENQIISITSTISGEGKTFVAVNLGAMLAMSHKKVVIVDLDMRKPKVHLAFSDDNSESGVSTILIGQTGLEENIHATEQENLYYIPAGLKPPNPAELILSPSFHEFVEDLKERFDIIILDTPPVGLVTDGILAMKKSDFSIYVFKANYSKRNFVKSLHNLRDVNKFTNMSVILNAVGKSTTYGNPYGYGYGYGYGYYEEK